MTFEHLLGLVASAVGIGIIIWWVLSLFIAFLAAILHRGGHRKSADSLSMFSPAFMLRLAVAVMSVNLMGIGVAQAAAAPPEPGWHSTSPLGMVSRHAAWTPTSSEGVASVLPTVNDSNASGTRQDDPRWQPQPPVVDPGLLGRQPSRPATAPGKADVVVKDGDSLWSIVESRLGPFATDVDIALAWPKWYAANRATIGSDPSALLPGQVLKPPSPS
ncbi:LysM peptidoglycan-binding domain-containing protein [Paenarthrobacter nitroguajacolicus]|uniref:LysM peptidoglycan-binding domain-containing protein n=1 Tax=Paenarthrobacter nitroguajacolicus TaxID=211146 RepID=UPI003AF33DBC